MSIWKRWILATLAVGVAAFVLPGVAIDGILAAFVTSLVLGTLNTFVRPLLVILTIPVTIVTLGLFLIVINTAMVLLASDLVPGFHVAGFTWALLFSIIVAVVNSITSNRCAKCA